MSFEGKKTRRKLANGQDIEYSENKWYQGFICHYTGTISYNIQTCLLVYTAVYRTIGPLVFKKISRNKILMPAYSTMYGQICPNFKRTQGPMLLLFPEGLHSKSMEVICYHNRVLIQSASKPSAGNPPPQ